MESESKIGGSEGRPLRRGELRGKTFLKGNREPSEQKQHGSLFLDRFLIIRSCEPVHLVGSLTVCPSISSLENDCQSLVKHS